MATDELVQLISGERHAKETDRAVVACNDYLRMGVNRSLAQLAANIGEVSVKKPTLRTMERWSSDFDWQERAKLYDANAEREKTEAVAKRRREVMESGLANDFERVIELKRLAKVLKRQIYKKNPDHPHRYPNLWVRDVKQIGAGPTATREDVYRYNSPLIDDFRGVLDDLAKETGGRKFRQEVDLNGSMSLDVAFDAALEKIYGDSDATTENETE